MAYTINKEVEKIRQHTAISLNFLKYKTEANFDHNHIKKVVFGFLVYIL